MFLRRIDFSRRADPGNRRLRWTTIWFSLLLSVPLTFLVLVLFDASTAKTASKEGQVARKYFSPELITSSVQVTTDSQGEPVMLPVQQTIPASYEVEVEDGCRFSVPPEMFMQIRVGDQIRYRESRGRIYHDCEWDPR
jgi:hypothetical protein